MLAILSSASEYGPGAVALMILSVLAFSALIAFGAWRMAKLTERMERDKKLAYRSLMAMALLYIGSSGCGVIRVVIGEEQLSSLIGLPIALLLAYSFLHSAINVKSRMTEEQNTSNDAKSRERE